MVTIRPADGNGCLYGRSRAHRRHNLSMPASSNFAFFDWLGDRPTNLPISLRNSSATESQIGENIRLLRIHSNKDEYLKALEEHKDHIRLLGL